MAQGISISVGADTKAFAQGVSKGIVEPLEDVQDTFKRTSDAGDKAGDQLADSFTGAQRATDEYARDYQQMSQKIQESSRTTSRSMGDDTREFSRESSKGLDEIKDSARSNAIEVGASFTGGFDQAAGGLQGFLAEFLAGFGPGGVIAGIAAASVIGLVTAQVDAGTEAAEAQKAAISALATEYIEAGHSGTRSFDAVKASIEAMATSTDGSDVIITLQKAWDAAKTSGGDYQDIVEAIASGSPAEIARAQQAVEKLSGAHRESADTALSAARAAVEANGREATAVDTLRGALSSAEKQAKAAGRAQELAAEAGISQLQLKADAISQVGKAFDDAAGDTDSFINKQGDFDAAGFIKKMKAVRAELEKYKDSLAQSDLSPEAKKYLESQGAESAAAMLRGYQAASPKQKAQLDEIWSTAAVDNAGSYESALGKGLAKIKPKVDIPAPIVPAPDTSRFAPFFQTEHVARIVVEAYTRNGQRVG